MPVHDLPPIDQFASMKGKSPANGVLCEQRALKPCDYIHDRQCVVGRVAFIDTCVALPSQRGIESRRTETLPGLFGVRKGRTTNCFAEPSVRSSSPWPPDCIHAG